MTTLINPVQEIPGVIKGSYRRSTRRAIRRANQWIARHAPPERVWDEVLRRHELTQHAYPPQQELN